MEELLEVQRGEFMPAHWFQDPTSGYVMRCNKDIASQAFDRFNVLRSTVNALQEDVKQRCITFGWILKEIQETGLYTYICKKTDSYNHNVAQGYTSFYKFVQDVFGVKKKTAQRMVKVAENFCVYEQIDEERGDVHVNVLYAGYSYRQLTEMLSVAEEYRQRITPQISTRNIARLGQLYKKHTPEAGTTVENDLIVWKQMHDEEKERANEKKNRLNFVPAKTGTARSLSENDSDQLDFDIDQDEFDGEDERDVVTCEGNSYTFNAIKDGMLRQIELLKDNAPQDKQDQWKGFCDIVKGVLDFDDPRACVSREEYSNLQMELVGYKYGRLTSPSGEPAGGKLTLKNEAERKKWLENYRSWGVWVSVPDVDKTFYRYNFENGAALIVEDCTEWRQNYCEKGSPWRAFRLLRYAIIDEERTSYDSAAQGGVSGIIKWLTNHAKEL